MNVPVSKYLMVEREKTKINAKAMQLNFSLPSMDDMAAFVKDPSLAQKDLLSKYIEYYQKMLLASPAIPEVYGMLGFCYYYSGDMKNSQEYYQKAVSMSPQFFWFQYDLGVVYFEQKNYSEAVKALNNAINLPFLANLKMTSQSRVFRQIFFPKNISDEYKPESATIIAYQDCHLLAALSAYMIGDYKTMHQMTLKAVKSNFDHRAAYTFLLGVAAFELKHFSDAVVVLKRALMMDAHVKAVQNFFDAAQKAVGSDLGKGKDMEAVPGAGDDFWGLMPDRFVRVRVF